MTEESTQVENTQPLKPIDVNVDTMALISWAHLQKMEKNDLKSVEDRDVQKLKNAIVNRGFSFPFYVWYGHEYVIDGAGRSKALAELEQEGYTIPDLPVVYIRADSFEQAKALVLQASSEHGKITQESLNAFLEDIDAKSLVDSISLPEFDLEAMLNMPEVPNENVTNVPAVDPDEEVPPPERPFTVLGDVYQIGKHRLVCGDSTDYNAVQILMDGTEADMVFTDPPYNVDYTGKTKDALKIENDSFKDAQGFYDFLYNVYTNLFTVTKEGCAIYVCHADSEGLNFRKAMIDAGWLLKQCCIWVKQTMVMGRQDYHWKHEPILYGWKPGAAHNWYTDRKQTTVWNFDRPMRNAEHPTMKPIDLVAYPIGNSCAMGGVVLDLFGGSGSTMVAAHSIGRIGYSMELDPKYCDVIVKRMKRCYPDLQITRNGAPFQIPKEETPVENQQAV